MVYQRNNLWPFQRDPYFNYTTLLLQGNVPNTTGPQAMTLPLSYNADASTNNFLVTPNGDVGPRPFSPYFGGNYSFFTDSTANYLQIPSNPALALGASDFCIEYWVYPTSTTNRVISWAAANCPIMYMESDQTLKFENYGVGSILQSVAKIPLNQWTHCAVSRASGVNRMFINGALVATTTNNQTWGQANLNIGVDISSNAANGYISNLRVVKGSAVYTAAFTPSTEPLRNIPNTILLTCQSNRFIDNSTANSGSGFAITVAGSPRITDNSPFVSTDFTTGAGYFDGNGDYLSAAANSVFDITGDFTVDSWIYLTADPATNGSGNKLAAIAGYSNGSTSNAGWELYVNFTGNTLSMTSWGTVNAATCSFTPVKNTWYHIAITKSGSTSSIFVNGVSQTLTVNALTINAGSSPTLNIGRSSGASSYEAYFPGYISNFRLIKGVAVYTGNFSPPSLANLGRSGATSVAAYPSTNNVNTTFAESATSLLTLQTRAPSQNINFIDSSPNEFIVTKNGNTTQGTFSPFSPTGWGNYFDGVSGTYLSIPRNTNMLPGANTDFTFEAWIYLTATPSAEGALIAGLGEYGIDSDWNFFVNSSLQLGFWFGSVTSAYYNTAQTISLNTWTHVAVSRSGTATNNLKIFVSGVGQSATQNATTVGTGGRNLSIGADQNGDETRVTGYISNLRLINGQALYTGNFTPPTAAFTATSVGTSGANVATSITGTVALLTCQSNRFVDNGPSNLTVTRNGTASVQAFSPFAPANAVSPLVTGGSGYFDGTGDYLQVAANTNLNFGTGNFTVEAWVYTASTGTLYFVIGDSTGDGFFGYESGNFTLGRRGIANDVSTSGFTMPQNQWTHVAFTRAGTSTNQTRIFVNGVLRGIGTTSQSYNFPTNISIVGGTFGSWPGYFTNLRLVKGTVVSAYSTSSTTVGDVIFSPPTAPLTAITDTSLLLNFTNGGIVDATGKNNLETVANSGVQTSQAKWSPGSMYFDGGGDWLVVPKTGNWSIGSSEPFTIEAWVYLTAAQANYRAILSDYNSGTPGSSKYLFINSSGIEFQLGTTAGTIASCTQSFSQNQWYYIAITRNSSNVISMYVDGTSKTVSQATQSGGFLDVGSFFYVGRWGGATAYEWYGYIDDLRITKGIARTITASPTGPFPLG
jgi:hypothetical protein